MSPKNVIILFDYKYIAQTISCKTAFLRLINLRNILYRKVNCWKISAFRFNIKLETSKLMIIDVLKWTTFVSKCAVRRPKDANGMTNSADLDQTAL